MAKLLINRATLEKVIIAIFNEEISLDDPWQTCDEIETFVASLKREKEEE